MKLSIVKLSIVSGVLLATAAAFSEASPDRTGQPAPSPHVVAIAGNSRVLSVTRLSDLLGNSTAGLEVDVARQVAILWANYHLIGMASAANDSLTDPAVVDYALWADIANLRYQQFRALMAKDQAAKDSLAPHELYASGQILAARHVLVAVDSTASAADRAAARSRINAFRSRISPSNFESLAREGDRGDQFDLGVFVPGTMVSAFENALRATPPGGISDVVETSFGYHLIYRPTFEEVSEKAGDIAGDVRYAVAESTFVARLDREYDITVADSAVSMARAIARKLAGHEQDHRVLARYRGGQLTAAQFAAWIEAFPPTIGMVPRLTRGPDSMVVAIVARIARSEVQVRMADSAGIRADAAETARLAAALRSELAMNWTQLGIAPPQVAAAAKTREGRLDFAADQVERYFDVMVREEAPYVAVPFTLARALRKRFAISVNEDALEQVVARARTVRATMDSVRAQTAPVPGSNPTAVPTAAGMQSPPQLRQKPPGGGR